MKNLLLVLVAAVAGAAFQDLVFERPEIKNCNKTISGLREERGQAVKLKDLPDGMYEVGEEVEQYSKTAIVWPHSHDGYRPILVSKLPQWDEKGLLFNMESGQQVAVRMSK